MGSEMAPLFLHISIGNWWFSRSFKLNSSRWIQWGDKYYIILGSYWLVSGEAFSFLGLISGSFFIHPVADLFPIEILGMGDSISFCNLIIWLSLFTGYRDISQFITVKNLMVFRGLIEWNRLCFKWLRWFPEEVLPEVRKILFLKKQKSSSANRWKIWNPGLYLLDQWLKVSSPIFLLLFPLDGAFIECIPIHNYWVNIPT